jgi:hypothetical protein
VDAVDFEAIQQLLRGIEKTEPIETRVGNPSVKKERNPFWRRKQD